MNCVQADSGRNPSLAYHRFSVGWRNHLKNKIRKRGDDLISKKKYKTTITRALKDDALRFFKENYSHNNTRSRYVSAYNSFITFCREKYNCKTKEDCELYIQAYEKNLENKGYTPSTIHNKLAPICVYHNINMNPVVKDVYYRI